MKNEPIVIDQIFNAPINKVWKAITDKDEMIKWFFSMIESFKPEAGFETKFNVKSGGNNFLHLWKVTEVVPGEKITLNWKYESYPGNSYVTFELSSLNNQTKLKLTHEGQETFPQDIKEFTRESCTAGWNFFIGESLKKFLEK
jgi:uncharacterized protein YndB with AHSA1/START domain